MEPSASIVVPTRERQSYLEVALDSIRAEAAELGAEVVVVDDGGPDEATRELAERLGARYEAEPAARGLNAARNTGVRRTSGSLVVFVDDDIRAHEGWLAALLEAAREHPLQDVFAGRISASLEGPAPRTCGRELPPITTLELGSRDRRTRFAWGSNMAIRRAALERVGAFDANIGGGGDEQEWQERAAPGSTEESALYVARAWVEHRRAGDDARLRSLARASYLRGTGARRFEEHRGVAPKPSTELRTLLGCAGHVIRRDCPAGLTMVAHSVGRLRQALAHSAGSGSVARSSSTPPSSGGDFLSGSSGTVGGLDAIRRLARDRLAGVGELLGGRNLRLELAARRRPPLRRVLVLSVTRPEKAQSAAAIRAELESSRHDVQLHSTLAGDAGKFENLNRLLEAHPAKGHDWLLVIDDDVELPGGFLDRFLFLCERFSLTLAQPAHRLHSHAAWEVTRRRVGSVVRETSFVEIGPVTAFAARSFDVLLPFPELRMGWGLDVHWAALAREHGWRCGVTDAVAINHRQAPAGAAYAREQAMAEARAFLEDKAHVSAEEAQQTLATHTRW